MVAIIWVVGGLTLLVASIFFPPQYTERFWIAGLIHIVLGYLDRIHSLLDSRNRADALEKRADTSAGKP